MLYEMIKTGTSWAASAGTGIIIGATLRKVVPLDSLQTKEKVLVIIGSTTIAYMAGGKVSEFVGEQFDEAKEIIDDFRDTVRKNKEEKRKAKELKK